MPRIANIGTPLPRPTRRGQSARDDDFQRFFDRLWPAPDWASEAAADPWGAAVRRAFRQEAGKRGVFFRRLEGNEAWHARRVRVHRRIAERLAGEAAVGRIAEGFQFLDFPLDPAAADRHVRQKWGSLRPDVISATAIAYAVVGHRRAFTIWPTRSGHWLVFLDQRKRPASRSGSRNCKYVASLAEAIAALQPPIPVRRRKRPSNGLVFRVYPTEDGFGIGRLVGPKPLRRRIVLRTFATRAEAEACFEDTTELNRLNHAFRAWCNWPKGNYAEGIAADRWENVRRGPDRRAGDIALEEFNATFAPRGIAFGSSVPQWERQRMLNRLYDQAMDLAECLGIEPADMFLGRKVGLALGCWGHQGSRWAFYNSTHAVIALSRRKGGSAFAHEWFHALDHHARDGGKKLYLSSALVRRLDAACAEGGPTYSERCEASELRQKCLHRNSTPPGQRLYRSTPIEMGARAAEALLNRLARKRNWRGTPAPGMPCWEEWRDKNAGGHFWYPTPAELDRVAQDLIGEIRRALDRVTGRHSAVRDFHVIRTPRQQWSRKIRRPPAIAAAPSVQTAPKAQQ